MARRQKGSHLRLLLLFTLLVLVGFAFPRLIWATHLGYSLIALLLTQVMVRDDRSCFYSPLQQLDSPLLFTRIPAIQQKLSQPHQGKRITLRHSSFVEFNSC